VGSIMSGMKYRILLVNPWIHDFAAFNLWARPLGLLRVAEYLSAFNVELLWIDCTDAYDSAGFGIGKYHSEIIPKPEPVRPIPRYYKRYGISPGEFQSKLASLMPFDLVLMTSVMTYWYPGVQETIRNIREIASGLPIVLGGIYPTLYPDHARTNSGADKIFRGPVNDSLVPIVRDLGLDFARTRNAVPYYTLGLASGRISAPLLTSTGCPYRCSYCASNLLFTGYARRPAGDILEEIRHLSALGIRDFAFYDDALLYRAGEHIKPLLSAVVRAGLNLRFHAPNGLHARLIDSGLSNLMKSSGFVTVRLSLETTDQGRQRDTGGKVTTSDFEQAVGHLKGAGFTKEEIGAYLLYGLPGQEWKEVEEGVDFLKRLGIRIHLAEFSPIRGTASWEELVKRGAVPEDLDPLLCNNTVYSYLYAGYDRNTVEGLKIAVKEYNRR
jgi:hypothetical protein